VARDHVALARAYQADVLEGRIPACVWVRRALERQARDLERANTPGFPYWFDPAAAANPCQIAELLPHIKGPDAFVVGRDAAGREIWNPLVLQPWQCWILTTIFGWRRVEDGRRRFKVAFVLVPRKNAKSTLASVVVIKMLVADGESGAECYSAATTRDQAKIIGSIVWEMVRRSPDLRAQFGIKLGSQTTQTLNVPANASKFAPLSSDASTLDGLNVSFAAIDEFHAHKTRDVYDVIDTSTGTRPNPLIMPITTAGVEIGGVCHEKLQYLEKILDGVVDDPTWFGINYTIDTGDDIRDPVIQRKANPNYGVSVRPDDLERKIAEAQQSPAAMNNVLTKHFNVWIRTESAWMTATLWQTCTSRALARAAVEIPTELRRVKCWIGVDAAEVRDIFAVVALFKMAADAYKLFGWYYLPTETIRKSPIAQLSGWVRDGFIIETPGDQADFPRIEADILGLIDRLNVIEVDFDRALAAHMQQDLKRALEPARGRDAVEKLIVTVNQNVETMDPAMKMVERLVLAGKLEHDGNPAMSWQIANVVVERNLKDELYPRKAGGKDSPNKIDGPVALFTCLSRAMAATEPAEPLIYVVGGGRR
jgi:phage terminase large subunit-like protein